MPSREEPQKTGATELLQVRGSGWDGREPWEAGERDHGGHAELMTKRPAAQVSIIGLQSTGNEADLANTPALVAAGVALAVARLRADPRRRAGRSRRDPGRRDATTPAAEDQRQVLDDRAVPYIPVRRGRVRHSWVHRNQVRMVAQDQGLDQHQGQHQDHRGRDGSLPAAAVRVPVDGTDRAGCACPAAHHASDARRRNSPSRPAWARTPAPPAGCR